jgi:hypothetical protein
VPQLDEALEADPLAGELELEELELVFPHAATTVLRTAIASRQATLRPHHGAGTPAKFRNRVIFSSPPLLVKAPGRS